MGPEIEDGTQNSGPNQEILMVNRSEVEAIKGGLTIAIIRFSMVSIGLKIILRNFDSWRFLHITPSFEGCYELYLKVVHL